MSNQKSSIKDQKSELYAIGATLLQADYLDELIDKFSEDPDETEFVLFCRFMKRTRLMLEYLETNMGLREKAAAYAAKKEHPPQDDSPNNNEGELINNPEAA